MSDLFDVKGKVVLVTGGGKGVGKMISTGFVQAGARVYISSRDVKSLTATADELTKLGPGQCFAIPADLQRVDSIEVLAKELGRREKCLHVLVNNSGANWAEDLEAYPDSAFTKVFTLNLQRVFTLTQKLLPLLLASIPNDTPINGPWDNPARIINIGSIDGLRVPPQNTYAYSSSKAALHHLSRVFAAQLGRKGITSNAIACGPFESKMMAATLASAHDHIVSGIPVGRIGAPGDVAGACIFLASRAGSFVNGATIPLDGGLLVSSKL